MDQLRIAVKEAKDAGGSIRMIADELGRSPQTIQRWLADSPRYSSDPSD